MGWAFFFHRDSLAQWVVKILVLFVYRSVLNRTKVDWRPMTFAALALRRWGTCDPEESFWCEAD